MVEDFVHVAQNATSCIKVMFCVVPHGLVVSSFYCLISYCWYIACRWYFGKIKRIEAEKKLLQADNEHGSFLIRDSESRHHDFSLSSRYCVEDVSREKNNWSRCSCLIYRIEIVTSET